MIMLSKYDMSKISKQIYYIRCKECVSCPCCGSKVRVIGSRKRNYINKAGEKITLIIRRLRCRKCQRVHHELPDILVPYKRYESSCIENVLIGLDNTIPVEESTIYRWKKWFNNLIIKILLYLLSISDITELRNKVFNDSSIISFHKSYHRWLAILVRQIIILDLW